jgi:predicted HTH transcriptional regulator
VRGVKFKPKLDELLKQDETRTLDFKREIRLISDKDKFEFAKDISAFANTEGGNIVYGKEDKSEGGRAIGIDPQSYDADQMQQIITQRCNPPPIFTSKLTKAKRKWFVILEIPESKLKPVELTQNRDVWIRRGATSDKATEREREQMRARRGKRTLEERLASEGISEESENWLRRAMIH